MQDEQWRDLYNGARPRDARLGIPEYDPTKVNSQMISLMKAAEQLGILY